MYNAKRKKYQVTKSRSLSDGNNRPFFQVWGKEGRTPWATSRPLDHGRIHLISFRPSSTFTVALPGTKWVGGGLTLGRDQRLIVA